LSTRSERVKAFPGGVFYLETETEALVATLASDLARQHGFKLDAPAPATPE
jgi:surfactin synthase thioesterase subunit